MSDDAAVRRALERLEDGLQRSGTARARWLEALAATDPSMVRELRALLAAAARPGILDTPVVMSGGEELLTTLRVALDDRYEIRQEMGRGGMATVFLAQERKHDRPVVIKVLDPSSAHLFGAERFLREVRIAAALAHPHIVPLIDSGEANGILYYVMPWMEGETLRDRLRRGRPTLAQALAILRDLAGALSAAHGAGIVHRDLKPENVLLAAGHAYLLDFGIAKSLHESFESETLTSPGLQLGTRRYMAPEQAVGAADVDRRADVYAWGVLAVEVLTGVVVSAAGAERTTARVLADRGGLSPALVAGIRSCVALDPERRPATMQVVAEWLDVDALARGSTGVRSRWTRGHRRLALTAGAVALPVAVGVAFWRRADGTASHTPTEPVAMTVLRNETGDSTLGVLGRFAGDWVTDGLQRTGLVRVVPWSEARVASERAAVAGAPLVAAMRDAVRAGTVVTGSIYRHRDSLQFHSQLVDASSGRTISSLPTVVVPLDSSEAGISRLRDRVMGAVAALRDTRVAALSEFTRSPPAFPAYQAFDVGFDHFLGQRYREALGEFRAAYARDTTFTLALLLGARAAWNSGDLDVADSLVARARAGRRDLGTYHESVLRFLEAMLAGDGAAARVAIRRAATVAPHSRAGYDLATVQLDAGYAREARAQLRMMDPDQGELLGWSSYWTQLAHAEYLLGAHDAEARAARELARRYPDRRVAQVLEARALAAAFRLQALDSALVAWDSLPADVYWSRGAAMVVAAEELMRRGREVEGRAYGERAVAWLTNRLVALPTDRAHRYWLGSALYDLGRYAQARPYFERLARDHPERLSYRGLAAVAAARGGDRASAMRWLGTAPRADRGEHLAFQARLAAIAGDTEQAISLLTAALDAGINGFAWLPGSAFRDFEALERSPRGRALLQGR
ncbi:MAG: protein kinase [Gemmatimonadaceae bacterium]|nr:protein kinase [Gemmatimonadaceae bacterium]